MFVILSPVCLSNRNTRMHTMTCVHNASIIVFHFCLQEESQQSVVKYCKNNVQRCIQIAKSSSTISRITMHTYDPVECAFRLPNRMFWSLSNPPASYLRCVSSHRPCLVQACDVLKSGFRRLYEGDVSEEILYGEVGNPWLFSWINSIFILSFAS